VRSGDFFVVDEDATTEINGGFPPIQVLDGALLADLRSGPLPSVSDVSAAEALCDLMEDSFLEYASWGRHELTDKEMSEVSRTFETVTDRLGMPANLPFRNFTNLGHIFRPFSIFDDRENAGLSSVGGRSVCASTRATRRPAETFWP
jgi:hypothetical protein